MGAYLDSLMRLPMLPLLLDAAARATPAVRHRRRRKRIVPSSLGIVAAPGLVARVGRGAARATRGAGGAEARRAAAGGRRGVVLAADSIRRVSPRRHSRCRRRRHLRRPRPRLRVRSWGRRTSNRRPRPHHHAASGRASRHRRPGVVVADHCGVGLARRGHAVDRASVARPLESAATRPDGERRQRERVAGDDR